MSKKTKRERQDRLFRRKVIIIGAIIIAVISLGSFALFQFLGNSDEPTISPEDKKINEAVVKRTQEDGELRERAREEIKTSDPAKAEVVYQQAADNTSDIKRKIELYVELANVYYDAGKPDEAIAVAKKAADLNNDKFLAADWLSRAYEDQKDYPEALRYYQLAKESISSQQNVFNFDNAYFDRQINRVKELQSENK